jgi:hypothetical protein
MKIGENDTIINAAVWKSDILSFVRISWLIELVLLMLSKVFKNNPQGIRLRRPKYRWCNCVQILITAKLKTGNGVQKTELTGRSPFRRRSTCTVLPYKQQKQ